MKSFLVTLKQLEVSIRDSNDTLDAVNVQVLEPLKAQEFQVQASNEKVPTFRYVELLFIDFLQE